MHKPYGGEFISAFFFAGQESPAYLRRNKHLCIVGAFLPGSWSVAETFRFPKMADIKRQTVAVALPETDPFNPNGESNPLPAGKQAKGTGFVYAPWTFNEESSN